MKHLKLYEEIENLDSYMVLQNITLQNKIISFNKIQYTIFKVHRYINTDKDYVQLTKLYYYYTDGKLKKITPPDYFGNFSYHNIREIVYESPYLQDCIDKLPLLVDTSKYNM